MFSGNNNSGGDKIRRRNLLDTIAKVVLAGIFAVSLLLNIVLIVVVVVMSQVSSQREREFEQKGYQKIYSDTRKFPFSNPDSTDEIAIIHINGVITQYDARDGMFGYIENPVSGVKNRLNIIREDKNIRGVLLAIESPGGSVTASDVLYNAIREFRAQSGIPVVSFIRQMAASGGYYIASASDEIVAYPTALTGSIGVIMYTFNFKGLMDKYGIEYVAIKTSKHKDSLSPFKDVDKEEIAWNQKIVDRLLDRFIDAVAQGRTGMTREQVKDIADGRLYLADEARAAGLIDATGDMEDAVKILSKIAGITRPAIVEFTQRPGILEKLGQLSYQIPRRATGLLLRDIMHDQATNGPGFFYMVNKPYIE
jgi:protease-4